MLTTSCSMLSGSFREYREFKAIRATKVAKGTKVIRATKDFRVSKEIRGTKESKAIRVIKAIRANRDSKAIRETSALKGRTPERRGTKVIKVIKAQPLFPLCRGLRAHTIFTQTVLAGILGFQYK